MARARVELFALETAYEQGRRRLGAQPPPVRAGVLTDAEGRFLIAAPESGMWRLVVSASGYIPMEYPLLPLTEETDVPAIELPRDTGLQVRVTTGQGTAVSGARLLATSVRVQDAYAPPKPAWEPAEQTGTTDAEGRATLAGSVEPLRVEVRAQGYVEAVLSGIRSPRLEVRLSSGSERRILVRDPRGRLAGGVLAWTDESEIPAAISDPQGQLALALPARRPATIHLLAATGERAEADLPAASPKAATGSAACPPDA